jgi:hypothetical protein
MTWRAAARSCASVLLLLAVAGCSGTPHRAEVLSVAGQSQRAYQSDDGAQACTALAPKTKRELEKSAGKPCAQAVLEEDVPDVGEPQRVEVFGTMAQIRYGAGATFLARFQGGWKVMAAGCRPQHAKPYDCTIQGG